MELDISTAALIQFIEGNCKHQIKLRNVFLKMSLILTSVMADKKATNSGLYNMLHYIR